MNNNPTIGVFTKQLDNWSSGSGHHLNEMMKAVLKINTKLRFIFIHYRASDNPIYKLVDGEIIIPRNPLRAAAILRQNHFDVLHFTPLTFFAPIWNTPGKKMATIHGVEQLLVPQFYGPIEMVHERYLVPVYARKMDHIITVSQTSKDFFIEHYRVKQERVSVCYNAVNDSYRVLPKGKRVTPDRLTTASEASLKPGGKFVFHISRFSERKNPWTILKGFAEFSSRSTGENTKLVIAGGRWDNKKVLAELKNLGIENKVILAGFVEEEEAVQLYNSATAFIFPSLAEGFGMPNIEAMVCGCPVIT
jgi:glycosyltransferase involved in cell wall biosynthesis